MLNQNLFLSTFNACGKNKIHFDNNFLNGILNDEEYLKAKQESHDLSPQSPLDFFFIHTLTVHYKLYTGCEFKPALVDFLLVTSWIIFFDKQQQVQDHILNFSIPGKGRLLNSLSQFRENIKSFSKKKFSIAFLYFIRPGACMLMANIYRSFIIQRNFKCNNLITFIMVMANIYCMIPLHRVEFSVLIKEEHLLLKFNHNSKH